MKYVIPSIIIIMDINILLFSFGNKRIKKGLRKETCFYHKTLGERSEVRTRRENGSVQEGYMLADILKEGGKLRRTLEKSWGNPEMGWPRPSALFICVIY